jgi:hypothetical protein
MSRILLVVFVALGLSGCVIGPRSPYGYYVEPSPPPPPRMYVAPGNYQYSPPPRGWYGPPPRHYEPHRHW